MVALFERLPKTGLVGEEIDVETGQWKSATSHVGGGIDSYYEYLLKCERLFQDRECGDMWRPSVAAVNLFLADDGPSGLWYGEADMRTGRRTSTTYGALQAFFPAVLAWAATCPARAACRNPDSGCGCFTASSRRFSTTAR